MADSETIVTKFTADTAELEAAVRGRLKPIMDEYVKQTGQADKSTEDLENTIGSLSGKLEVNAAAHGRVASEEKKEAAATADLSREQKKLTQTVQPQGNIFQRLFASIKSGAKSAIGTVKDFGRGAKEGFAEGIKGAGGFRGILTQVGQNLKGFGGKLKSAFTGLFSGGGPGGGGGPLNNITRGLDSAGVSTGRLGGLIRGLASPLGLVAGAAAGFLLNMTRLDSVKVILDGVKRGVTGILDQLAAGKFSISGFFEAFARGQEVAEQLDKINDKRQAGLLLSKQEEEQVNKLLVQSRNRTAAEEDRVKLLKQVQEITTKGSEREIQLAQQEADLAVKVFKQKILDQNKLTTSTQEQVKAVEELTAEQLESLRALKRINLAQTDFVPIEIDDEAAQAAIDAVNKVRDARIAADSVIEQAQNRIDLLLQQGQDKRAAAAQKALEDAEKRAKKLAEIASAEGGLSDIRIEVQDEGLKAAVSEVERAVIESDQKFANLEKKERAFIAELAKLGRPVDEATQKVIFGEVERARKSAEEGIRAEAQAKEEKDTLDAQQRITAVIGTEGQRRLQAIRDEFAERLKDNDKFITNEVQHEANRVKLLLALDERLAEEQKKIAQEANAEQVKLLEDNLTNLESFLERSIELLSRRNDAEQQARDERIAAINEDFAAQLSANEQFDQSEQNRTRKRDAILAEQAAAVAAERERLAGEEKTAREARSKELIAFLLDELEKIILINAVKIESSLIAAGALTGPIGAAAGLAQGVAFALLIKALFAGVKAAVGAAYEGEPYVRGKQTWSGKDGHLRRVHTGERIVTTKDNAHHWDMLEAMRKGNLDRFIHTNYVLPELDKRGALPNGLTTAATLTRDPVQIVNSYVSTDTGQRVERSVMLAKYHDRNIVEAQARQTKEQRKTNALLEMMLAQAGTKRHSRTWAD